MSSNRLQTATICPRHDPSLSVTIDGADRPDAIFRSTVTPLRAVLPFRFSDTAENTAGFFVSFVRTKPARNVVFSNRFIFHSPCRLPCPFNDKTHGGGCDTA